ncbi:exported hypothetical protein [Nitrospina gracilis 3/211]|uniref:Secreted protein n=1 Tax=Nitrospina gracilis (strain 3/211) TaxID=1266370 RepID=M1ZCL2_NITG3|nr:MULTISPECIES: hypothetical protein [Nitrospina]MCF8723978.1 hypothetical protein [Nitrospina sp. Nb-3]CCQ91102.1 exported hypothetical protein [Nitrospina gracilis 3/211]
MKKMIAVLSMTLLLAAWSGVAVANEPIDLNVLDRNAVWTKKFEGSQPASQSASAEDAKETRAEAKDDNDAPVMNVRQEDRPWARVG